MLSNANKRFQKILTLNQRVLGSSPSASTIFPKLYQSLKRESFVREGVRSPGDRSRGQPEFPRATPQRSHGIVHAAIVLRAGLYQRGGRPDSSSSPPHRAATREGSVPPTSPGATTRPPNYASPTEASLHAARRCPCHSIQGPASRILRCRRTPGRDNRRTARGGMRRSA